MEELRLKGTGKKVYLNVADTVRKLIQEGHYRKGERLPSSREMAAQFKIHRHTITRALDQLVSEGWLDVHLRKGYQVKDELTLPRFPKRKTHRWRWTKKVQLDSFSPSQQTKFNFQSGLPDLDSFPLDEFRSFVSESLRNADLEILNYSSPFGHERLISAVGNYISRVRNIRNRQILITNGSQEAIYIAIQLLIKKGDTVAMEALCYPPARETFRAAGAKIIPIPMDEQGIIPEALEKIATRKTVKLLFLTPTHQFPTTGSLSASRKIRIYDIAVKHRIPIIEDDYDHEYHYRANPPAPMVSNDPANQVIYISTFSKVLFPSARIAFMAVPPKFADAFTEYRRIVTHQNEPFLQDALARWIETGGLEKHIRKMKKQYLEQRNKMIGVLTQHKERGTPLSWNVPEGGMGLWLNIHQDSNKIAALAMKEGIFVSPEWNYQIKHVPATHLRLGFASQSPQKLNQGLTKLLRILSSPEESLRQE